MVPTPIDRAIHEYVGRSLQFEFGINYLFEILPKKIINNRECQPTDPGSPTSRPLEWETKAQTYIFVFSTYFCIRISCQIPNVIPTSFGRYHQPQFPPPLLSPSKSLTRTHSKFFEKPLKPKVMFPYPIDPAVHEYVGFILQFDFFTLEIISKSPKKIINNRECPGTTPHHPTSKPLEWEPKPETYIFVFSTLFCIRNTH